MPDHSGENQSENDDREASSDRVGCQDPIRIWESGDGQPRTAISGSRFQTAATVEVAGRSAYNCPAESGSPEGC